MNAYTPKRRSRGALTLRVLQLRAAFAACFWRDYYTARLWLRRHGWRLALVLIVVALGMATLGRTADIYKPNPRVPFLPDERGLP